MKKIAFIGVMVAVVAASAALTAGAAEIAFTGGAGGNISSISGAVALDVSALPEAQSRSILPLFSVDKNRIASGTAFQAAGAKRGATVEYDDANGWLVLRQNVGTVIVFR